jgi:type I restriction enzyme, S subunit
MEVKPGYKQTELGMIPVEWGLSRLSDCGEVIMGQSPPGSSYNAKSLGAPLINGPTEFTDRYPIKIQWTTQPARFCKTGDLLICVRGSSTGRTNYANDSYAIGRGVAAIRASAANDTSYLSYQVIIAVTDILRAATGSTFPSVDGKSFRNIVVPLPPLSEQEAIAEALSDADALIESLEQLLVKKRQLKQGTMQQLLTGKKRLPGFEVKPGYKQTELGEIPEDWRLDQLPEVVWFQEGPGVRNYQFTSSGVKLFNGTNIERGRILLGKTSRHISEREAYGLYSHFLADSGDIVIACSGILVSRFDEKVGVLTNEHLPLCMNTSTMRFKVTSSSLHKEYFRHFLKSQLFKNQIGGTATGSAQLNFGPAHVSNTSLPMPTQAEQEAIAEALSDMDTEITALETKLTKTRQLKQGMMQELLTGRIRLV